jgi:hypothetical protein
VNVYAYYDATPGAPIDQAEKYREWAESWKRLGWSPRILTSRRAKQSPLYKEIIAASAENSKPAILPMLALHAAGGGWLVPLSAHNEAFKPSRPKERIQLFYPGVIFTSSRKATAELIAEFNSNRWNQFFVKHFSSQSAFVYVD